MSEIPDKKHNTIEKVKVLLKDYEKEDQTMKEFQTRKKDITNVLRSTLKMINDEQNSQFENISNSIKNWIENTKIEMQMTENALEEITSHSNRDKIRKNNFSEKVHIFRESHLSVLFFNDKNLKSLYYLILTLFLWLLLWVIIGDIKASGQIIDTKFWRQTFSGMPQVTLIWTMMFCYSFIVVFYVKLIENYGKIYNKINYFMFFTIYIFYQSFLYLGVSYFLLRSEYGIPCNLIVSCEMARISMKIHGYFREKLLYGLKDYHMEYTTFTIGRKQSGNTSQIANNGEETNSGKDIKTQAVESILVDIKLYNIKKELGLFLYYLFCPSLIYRDTYPRITYFRWNMICAHLFNFLCCILFFYILMRYICDPYFNYSKVKDYYSITQFFFDSLRFAIPGLTFLVVGFFLLLHSWNNLWSELLRHGDRRFYEDWWNSTNFEEYYRKWNMVVHEWLYYYIYNDVIRFSKGKMNRTHAKFSVFLLSVIVHEIIVWHALGFFFPILSFFFGGPGIIFTYIKPTQKHYNVMFWCKLFLGKGLILVLYLREFKVRHILGQIGLEESWHEWLPRSILIYFNNYKDKILSSPFY
jgi:sterol O-acyltransferase